MKALAADLVRAWAAAASVAPRGCDVGRAAPWAPGGSRPRICPRPSASSSRQRRGTSGSPAGVDGRHPRPSIRRTRAPGRRTVRRRRARVLKHFSPPFGGPRGGAGARVTRAPGRPRWVETRFGPRRAPGLGASSGARIFPTGIYSFPGKLFPPGPGPGPKCLPSTSVRTTWASEAPPPSSARRAGARASRARPPLRRVRTRRAAAPAGPSRGGSGGLREGGLHGRAAPGRQNAKLP